MHVTAISSHAEEGGYVAFNPETGTTTEGNMIDRALANLREAVERYFQEFPIKLGAAPLVATLDTAIDA